MDIKLLAVKWVTKGPRCLTISNIDYLLPKNLPQMFVHLPCWLEFVIPGNLGNPRPINLIGRSTQFEYLVQLFRLQQTVAKQKRNCKNKNMKK